MMLCKDGVALVTQYIEVWGGVGGGLVFDWFGSSVVECSHGQRKTLGSSPNFSPAKVLPYFNSLNQLPKSKDWLHQANDSRRRFRSFRKICLNEKYNNKN